MTIPHYKIVEIGGKNLVVFYPQFKDDEGYKIIDLENRFPIELKNEEEYKMFLEAIIASEDAIKDGLKTLADLVDEMSLLAKGPKGDTRFMWVKYADDDKGSGMSDNPDGKKYIGMAFNKDIETPSDNASDYKWVKYVADYEGLEIGGRNLLRDSNNFSKSVLTPYDGSTITVTENVAVEEWGTDEATRIIANSGNRTSILKVFRQIQNSTKTVEGETYTISLFIKNNRDVSMSVRVRGLDGDAIDTIRANEVKRVVVTGVRNSNYFQIQFRSREENFHLDCTVFGAQVEKGTVATDWSPAPEDIFELIDNVDKAHVGLSNVQNYGIALESQAKAGVSNATYMTPLRTKQAIDHQRPTLIERKSGNVPADDFPTGISFMDIDGSGTSDGYPQNFGTVITYKSANNRISQEFVGNGFNSSQEVKYTRHYHPNNSFGGWTEWHRAVFIVDTDIGDDYVLKKYSDGTFELDGHETFTVDLDTAIGDFHRTGNRDINMSDKLPNNFIIKSFNACLSGGTQNMFLTTAFGDSGFSEGILRYRLFKVGSSETGVKVTINYGAYGTWS